MKFNPLIPELIVSDLARSRRFYLETLGFKVEYERLENHFVFLSREDAQLMLEEKRPGKSPWLTGRLVSPFGRGINLQIMVSRIAPIVAALRRGKHPIILGPEDHWYRAGEDLLGCREVLVQDPDGYLLRFSEDLGRKAVRQ